MSHPPPPEIKGEGQGVVEWFWKIAKQGEEVGKIKILVGITGPRVGGWHFQGGVSSFFLIAFLAT